MRFYGCSEFHCRFWSSSILCSTDGYQAPQRLTLPRCRTPLRYRVALFALPLLTLLACHEEGPGERAGKALDQAGEKMQDAINPPGPAEKAGRAIDKATE